MNSTAHLVSNGGGLRKDRSLDLLAQIGNVAQFVSFAPRRGRLIQTYSRVIGFEPNTVFASAEVAIRELLQRSADKAVNFRSYSPESPRSRRFEYGVVDLSKAMTLLEEFESSGLFVIVNETVDVHDGGVSGVVEGNVIEFAPDDTPRCVEKPGVASLPRDWGIDLLEKVYRLKLDLPQSGESRVEFSLHPRPRGWRQSQTLTWEYERISTKVGKPILRWPNRFSQIIGDKVFGLLVAERAGVPVPRTLVIPRRIAPFEFGTETGSNEVWFRTAPRRPEPGKYTTMKGWTDPFLLMQREDADESVASVVCQAAIKAAYSGAAIVLKDGTPFVEGRAGEGDTFMLGEASAESLPEAIHADVLSIFAKLREPLGPVRFEWVHDGSRVWIVQLHKGATQTTQSVVVPGDAPRWVSFEVERGLEEFRTFLAGLDPSMGVSLLGGVGLTSHLADLARKSRRPTRIVVG